MDYAKIQHRVAELRRAGTPIDSIAKDLGISKESIMHWSRKAGVVAENKKRWAERADAVGSLRRAGKTVAEVSQILGIAPKEVVYWSGKAGIPKDRSAKIRDRELQIAAMAQNGVPRADISRQLSIAPSVVTRVLQKLNLDTIRLNSGLTQEQKERIRQNHHSNRRNRKTNKEMSLELGVSSGQVKIAKKQMNLSYSADELLKYCWQDLEVAVSRIKNKDGISVKLVGPESGFTTTSFIECICFCSRQFRTMAQSILYRTVGGCGCQDSRSQMEILDYVRSLGEEALSDKKGLMGDLREIDIWIPDKQVAIESCGFFWHGETRNGPKAIQRHYRKFVDCRDRGIRLLTVWENEWYLRREAVCSFIKAALKISPDEIIGARECHIECLTHKQAKNFIEENHIQGMTSGKYWGLLDLSGRIVCAIGIKKKGDKQEIVRFCVLPNAAVRGGFQKLLSHVRKMYPSSSFMSFSDNRWSIGGVYQRAGFVMTGRVKPSYWYARKGSRQPIFHKSRFRKSKIKGIKPKETEWEAMKRLGWDRVWDCGKIRWQLPPLDAPPAT